MKIKDFMTETFQNVSINGILYSLNGDEKTIYSRAKEEGKLMKDHMNEYDQRIANGLVTRGLLKRRKNPQHEIYFTTKGRRKVAGEKQFQENTPPDAELEKWIADNEEKYKEKYGKQYKSYLYGKAWNKFNGKSMVKESIEINEEITPSRLWKYQESDKIDFAILSADRSERSDEENAKLNKELKKDIKDLGYWYTELKGGYIEVTEGGQRVPVDGENSLLIPNMKKEEAIELGKKYDQDSVMFKDSKNKTLEYIVTNERNGELGSTDSSFETQAGKNNFSVSSGNDLDYYSRLPKSNKPDLKVGFNWKG